ncbi:flavin reductase [candidate division KSB1 bacterium]
MSNKFKEVDPLNIKDNPFKLIGLDWMLITGGDISDYNTMTASWGGLGYLWEKNVAYCFIRPQRYTFGFIEKSNYYTFSFFEDKHRNVLNYCGNHSGRDIDKTEKTGVIPVEGPNNTVYFEEARLVLVIKKLYGQDLKRENFHIKDPVEEFYPPEEDVHKMFIGEVETCLLRE